MKRLLVGLFCSLFFGSMAFSNETGFISEKETNGGYKHSYVINFDFRGPHTALHWKNEATFSAPRSNATRLNHAYFSTAIGSDYDFLGGKFGVEFGGRYYWAGNDFGIPEGFQLSENTVYWLRKW